MLLRIKLNEIVECKYLIYKMLYIKKLNKLYGTMTIITIIANF